MAIKIINRYMDIPIPDHTVGYKGDNLVEIRTFELNRFYGDIDLSEFDFKLDTEINGTKNIIDLDKSVTEDKITLTWTVKESHILNPGHMSIQIRAFSAGEEKWHSAKAYVRVQPSINAEQSIPDPLPSEFVQMEQRVTDAKNAAIGAAQDAKAHADRAQELADTFEQTTLPAAITAVEAAGQAKVDLAEQQAERVEDIIQEAEQDVLPELRQAIEDGIETKDQLGGSIQEAGEAKTALDGSISSAGTAKGELDGSITEANAAKGQLDDSIDLAGNAKTELDGSITTAEQTKQALDESIATGDLVAFRYDFESHLNDYATYKDSNNLKVAKVEKELNDYKATMQQVNINQEPKQKATGYGTVSLPKNAANGQVSVVLKGNTIYNFLGNAGDCESINDFVFYQGTGVLDSNNKVFGNYGIKVTIASGYTAMSCKEKILSNKPLDTGRYYLVSAYVKNGNTQRGIKMRFWNGSTTPQSTTDFTGTYFSRIGFKLQPSDFSSEQSIYFDVIGAEGQYVYIDGIMVNEITQYEYNNLTVEQLLQKYPFVNNTKSTVCAIRLKSVSEDESEVSTAYVVAKDEQGKIAELRSLPNGVKDEIRPTQNGGYEHVKRVSPYTLQSSDFVSIATFTNVDAVNIKTLPNANWLVDAAGVVRVEGRSEYLGSGNLATTNDIGKFRPIQNAISIFVTKGTTLQQAIDMLVNQTLTYQLAEPIVTDINVSGNLISYPSGTVYVEPVVADAGIYAEGMAVLHQDLPIKAIEKVSKVDFVTGLETELDIEGIAIAEDKLSFTHPDLIDGDIVFFEYEYDVESTQGETEIEYYDSRYTIKDSVTGKFYKWNVTVADGVPSIELAEV